MRPWPAVEVPHLPGHGPALRLHDTATGQVRATSPGAVARIYVCGITPYDASHIGHIATYVAFDLVQRTWRDAGHEVHYTQNVTDVDDPLLERAARDGVDWVALAERETAAFCADMERLRVLPPREYVGAVESIPRVTDLVERLRDAGAAYSLDDGTGDIYFDVRRAKRFGYVSGLDEDTMLALFGERGGDPERVGKRNRLDPLLWRGRRPGEPSWDTRLGPGRPGWHIECAAIALDSLGMTIDVQGGGSDLAFPHHEMSAAHAEVATDEWPFARHYVHGGMVGLDGAKMSKSQGNLVVAGQLWAAGTEPAALRLTLLAGHYRADRDWTPELLADAERRLARWREAVSADSGPDGAAVLSEVRERLTDDLDSPGALAAVDRWADAAIAGDGTDRRAPALVRDTVDALLGIEL